MPNRVTHLSRAEVGTPEAVRLERLWAGAFGDAYVQRNLEATRGREPFWDRLLRTYPIARVLEVGCNVGANLQWIATRIPAQEVYGVEINPRALAKLRATLPTVNAVRSVARDLPFRDRWFDLVFTAGVLIHQPDEALPQVMDEIVRCARRYVLAIEYFAEETVEVPYRGQRQALFKRDYGRLYQQQVPSLRLVEQGHLTRMEGWDDANFWLFET